MPSSNFCTKCLTRTDAHTFRFYEGRVYCRPCLVDHQEWLKQLAELERLRKRGYRTRFEREEVV